MKIENRYIIKKMSSLAIRSALKEAGLFAVGGIGYYSLEVIFRGFSHWSMAFCGGLCLWLVYHLNRRMKGKRLINRALAGACTITAVEFAVGCFVNLIMGWDVWDYSHIPTNLLGQICMPFFLLWFLLCIPVCFIFGKTENRINKKMT